MLVVEVCLEGVAIGLSGKDWGWDGQLRAWMLYCNQEEQMAKTKTQTKTLKIKNCVECPHSTTKLTKGYGYAEDYICTATKRKNNVIAGYVEWPSEMPQDGEFPEWCPLDS
jgi:hypothetical protein